MPFTLTPNETFSLDGAGFRISFRPHNTGPSAGTSWDTETPEGETAIVVGEDRHYILNGDHREAYEALAPKGLSACIEYFRAHIDQISSWSNNPDKVPTYARTH